MIRLSLYWGSASPFVRKVMVCAHELGLAGRIDIRDSAANPIQRDTHIQAFNPLAKVPAAETSDGTALYDSRVICEYLDHLAAEEQGTAASRLFTPAGPARFAPAGAGRRPTRCGIADTLRKTAAAGRTTLDGVDRQAGREGIRRAGRDACRHIRPGHRGHRQHFLCLRAWLARFPLSRSGLAQRAASACGLACRF